MDRECIRCACTEDDPCIDDDGNTCAWISPLADICTFCKSEES